MRASFYRNFLKRLYPPTTTKASNSIHRIRNIMSESDQSIGFDTPRLVTKKILAKLQHEGDGAVVRRGIGRYFLLLLGFFFFLISILNHAWLLVLDLFQFWFAGFLMHFLVLFVLGN